ncbi:hypothetical protein J6590_002230 [Homalodisca vitripennis]|nr:hypothetical protein J6590_002230 [Homalodisca vitripennis]
MFGYNVDRLSPSPPVTPPQCRVRAPDMTSYGSLREHLSDDGYDHRARPATQRSVRLLAVRSLCLLHLQSTNDTLLYLCYSLCVIRA